VGFFYTQPVSVTRTVSWEPTPERRATADLNENLHATLKDVIEDHGQRAAKVGDIAELFLAASPRPRVKSMRKEIDRPPPNNVRVLVALAFLLVIALFAFYFDTSGGHPKIRDMLLTVTQTGFVGFLAFLGLEGAKQP
jgi:hypothetical protein